MKILHIVPWYYPAFKYGGPIESVHILNKFLVRRGIEVDVLTTNAGLEQNDNLSWKRWHELEGIRIKYFPYYFYENYTFSPLLLFAILKKIKNYDLVHITMVWNFPMLVAALACVLNNKPFIISPRGVLHKDAIGIRSKFFKLLYFNLIAKHYLNKANTIHYTTSDEKENIFQEINNNLIIIPNGIDLNSFNDLPLKGTFKNKYKILKDKQYILFLGRIHKQKGINLLVDAFKDLSEKYNELFLVIAGPDNCGYRKKIEKKLRDNNLCERTLFTGMLIGNEKLSAYVDAEVFLLPSYFENFGMSVVEAMACGTPVIISNRVGIYKDVEEYKAGLVIDLKPENLYNAIRNLLDNKEIAVGFSKNAKKLVREKYDIKMDFLKLQYNQHPQFLCLHPEDTI